MSYLRLSTVLVIAALWVSGPGCASASKKEADAPTAPATDPAFKPDVTADAVPSPNSAEIVPEMMVPERPTLEARGRDARAARGKRGSKAAREKNAKYGARHYRARGIRGPGIVYTVKPHDTLMKIAFELLGDVYRWREIYAENRAKLPDYNHPIVGTRLVVHAVPGLAIERNGTPYLIQPRDTLWGISDGVYGTPWKWRKLWNNNRQLIRDPDLIFADFYLYYLMNQQDAQEAERLKQRRPLAPPVLGAVNRPTAERQPASAGQGQPVVPSR